MNIETPIDEPKTLEDFDSSQIFPHPHKSVGKLFAVCHSTLGKGIWSVSLGRAILALNPVNNDYDFYPITSITQTKRIFWGRGFENEKRIIYMADCISDCAVPLRIPEEYYLHSVLSGKIMLLHARNITEINKYILYSLETGGIHALRVFQNSFLEVAFPFDNGQKIILVFNGGRDKSSVESGMFILTEHTFEVEEVVK